jgi:hypothetical protein
LNKRKNLRKRRALSCRFFWGVFRIPFEEKRDLHWEGFLRALNTAAIPQDAFFFFSVA